MGGAPVRIAAGLLAVFWGLLFFGLIDLLAFAQGQEFHDTILLSTGWGLVFLFLVAAPLFAVALAPRVSAAAAPAQVAAVSLSVAAAAGLSASPRHLVAAAALAATAGLLVGMRRTPGWLSTWQWSALPTALLVVAVIPAALYARTSADNTGTAVLTDDTWSLDHWPIQAALPIAILLVGTVAAGHPPGWRLPAWSVGLTGAWFGAVCWFYPDLVGSVSRGWAAVVLLWSVAFLVSTYAGRRRRRVSADG